MRGCEREREREREREGGRKGGREGVRGESRGGDTDWIAYSSLARERERICTGASLKVGEQALALDDIRCLDTVRGGSHMLSHADRMTWE